MCFVAEFKDTTGLADLKPSHQLAHLKQSVSEEAKCLLHQQQVETTKKAFEVLTELYEPLKDSSTLMQEILKISQQPGERLTVLSGRIEDAARKYAEMLALPSTDLEKLIASWFKHAIADAETQNQLLWFHTEMTLSHMVQKAQQFEDYKGCDNVKSLRTKEATSETSQLKKKIEELQKQISPLQTKQKGMSSSWRKPFICWKCGKRGHLAHYCRQEKVGDGFTYRPKHKTQATQNGKGEESTSNLN